MRDVAFIRAPKGIANARLCGKLVRANYPRTCTPDPIGGGGIDGRCSAGVAPSGALYGAFPCARHHAEWAALVVVEVQS